MDKALELSRGERIERFVKKFYVSMSKRNPSFNSIIEFHEGETESFPVLLRHAIKKHQVQDQ